MPRVFIPPAMRSATGGVTEIDVEAGTVGEAIDAVDRKHPGVRARICDGNALKSGLAVAVDGNATSLGLLQPVRPDSEIHVLPAIGGG